MTSCERSDVYNFSNEILSPTQRKVKVRAGNQYQEFQRTQLPFFKLRFPFLPVSLLRLKCQDAWLKLTGLPIRKTSQKARNPQMAGKISKPRRSVSFKESAEVRRIGYSQPQSSSQPTPPARHPVLYSPLKSEPRVSSANRCRRTTVKVVPASGDWDTSESPISQRMQSLEIGRRGSGSGVAGAGGDRIIDDEEDMCQFQSSPTSQDLTPPSSPLPSSFPDFDSISGTGTSSGIFSSKPKTYTGRVSRQDHQTASSSRQVTTSSPANPVLSSQKKLASSELISLPSRGQKSFASDVIPLVSRRPVFRILVSDLVPLMPHNGTACGKETPKTARHKTPYLVPKKPKAIPSKDKSIQNKKKH